jgi:ATP-dependent DNA ligase
VLQSFSDKRLLLDDHTNLAHEPGAAAYLNFGKQVSTALATEQIAALLPQPYRADRIRYASRYPLVVETILRLKVRTIVIDGEAMCFRGAAHDFDKLWNRTHDHEAKLCAFDLLELDGEDYRAKPLRERKQSLFKLLRPAYGGIEYVEHLEGDGPMIFEHACKLGLEGIVSKRIDLHYRAGLSQS